MVIAVDEAKRALEQSRSLNELLPWLLPWDNETVLCKDRSLLALLEYAPKDHDGRSPERINADATALERMLMNFRRNDVYFWFLHTRRKEPIPVPGVSDNVQEQIARSYYQNFAKKPHYQHRHFLGVLVRPEAGPGKFMESFRSIYAEKQSIIQSLAGTFKQSLGLSAMDAATRKHLEYQYRELQKIIESIESSASPLGRIRRLREKELWGALNHFASPSSAEIRPLGVPEYTLLDSYLGANTLEVGEDTLHFRGVEASVDVAVLSIKNEPDSYPEQTKPGVFDTLYEVDGEWTLSFALRMTDVDTAKGFMKQFRAFYNNTQKGLRSIVSEAVTENKSENDNDDAVVRSQQTGSALRSFATGNALAAYANITILVYGDAEKPLSGQVKKVNQALTEKEFLPLRENMHLLSAWAGTLPGQWALPVRWVFLTGQPMADMIPVHGIYSGHKINAYLSEQLNRTIPALAVFDTKENSAFYFNSHIGDLGHAFIAGPSRTGKSAMVNFLISQWLRYPSSRVFVFDKDYSNYITTILNGGAYLDYAADSGMRLNPMRNLQTPGDWQWFGQWAEQILSAKDGALPSEESTELSAAVERMKVIPNESLHLQILGQHCTGPAANRLRSRLSAWVGNGLWSRYFSAKEDDLSLSRYTTIAMDEVLQFAEPARAFLSYVFHRIEKSLTGEPTLIYIEEAWFALDDPGFSERLKQWLKRLAKKNVIVVMATQSAFDSADSKAFSSIIDNVPTLIFLPHDRASAYKDFYLANFQLDAHQVEILEELTPKKDYYVVQGGTPKIIQSRFDSNTLAYLRSDTAARDMFKRWQESGEPNWREKYVQEAQRLS